MADSRAISVGRAHIRAWSSHDWQTTRELLADDVHAVVTTTAPGRPTAELQGIDAYMGPKTKASSLIVPNSVQELSAVGDDRNALIVVSMKIGLGPGGAPVTMLRTLLYLLDENSRILEERDAYMLLA